ncbi:MAG: hypothetical protein WCI75_08640, partial [candidate division NC10 bacterium]
MSESIVEMKQKKMELLKQQRTMLDNAERQNRALNPAEQSNYKRFDADIDGLDLSIIGAEADLERRRKLAETEINMMQNGTIMVRP